ncbi:MAG: PilZ domain-containing protein [Magnetococcales bacterium]|nr:PilZ domain-containing protein [Magnetococcales bacterium]
MSKQTKRKQETSSTLCDDREDIQRILDGISQERAPVRMQADGRVTYCYGRLRLLTRNSGENHLFIEGVTPVSANDVLARARRITVQFFTNGHAVDAHVHCVETDADKAASAGMLEVSIPATLTLNQQKRESVRAELEVGHQMSATLTPSAARPFSALLLDISSTGASFICRESAPTLRQDADISTRIELPGDEEGSIRLTGLVATASDGHAGATIRMKFLFENYADVRTVEELVARIQRETLQRRRRQQGPRSRTIPTTVSGKPRLPRPSVSIRVPSIPVPDLPVVQFGKVARWGGFACALTSALAVAIQIP